MVVVFLLDALTIMADLSKKMQRRFGLIIEQHDIFQEFISSVEQLAALKSHYVVNLVVMSECTMHDGEESQQCVSIDNYFSAHTVVFKGLTLEPAPQEPPSPTMRPKTTPRPRRRGRPRTQRPTDSSEEEEEDDEDEDDDDDSGSWKHASIHDADGFRRFTTNFVELSIEEVTKYYICLVINKILLFNVCIPD